MNVEEAANELYVSIRDRAWLVSVGVGSTLQGPAIFVYVKSATAPGVSSIAKTWRGYDVIVRATGSVRPLDSTFQSTRNPRRAHVSLPNLG